MTRRADASSGSVDPVLALTVTMMLTMVPLAQAQLRLPDDAAVQASVPAARQPA